MLADIRNAVIASVRRRVEQGDCPTQPAHTVEMLENVILDLAPKGASDTEPCGYCGRTPCRCDRTDLCEAPGCDNPTDKGICAACDQWVSDQVASDTEQRNSHDDAEVYGIGIEVDGVAIHPGRVVIRKRKVASEGAGLREALENYDEALDAVADSIGGSTIYGPADAWAEGKTLSVLFKNTGQIAKLRFVGLINKPSNADLRGEPA